MFRQLVADLCEGILLSHKITVGANYLEATLRGVGNTESNDRTASLMYSPGTKNEDLWLILNYKKNELNTKSVLNNITDTLTKKEFKKLQRKIANWIFWKEPKLAD